MVEEFYEWAMSWTITLSGAAFWYALYSMLVVFLFSLYEVIGGTLKRIRKHRKG